MFFYCVISLAPVQIRITCNTEVTHGRVYVPPRCDFNASKSLPATSAYVSAKRLRLSLSIKSLNMLTPTYRFELEKYSRRQQKKTGWHVKQKLDLKTISVRKNTVLKHNSPVRREIHTQCCPLPLSLVQGNRIS